MFAVRKGLLVLIRSPQSFEWPAPRNCRLCRIISRQCLRFPANSLTSSSTMSGSPVNNAASSKTHFNQVFLGRPRDLFPCAGAQSSKYLGNLVSGILTTCPNQRRRFALMYHATGLILARSRTSSLLILWNHFTRRILLKQR